MPLELEFVGNFFSLADFFHDIKRFVHVANSNVVVSGRLVTVEGVKFASEPELFPRIKAEVTATVYLSPKVRAQPPAPRRGPRAGDRRDADAGEPRRPAPPQPAPTATATP